MGLADPAGTKQQYRQQRLLGLPQPTLLGLGHNRQQRLVRASIDEPILLQLVGLLSRVIGAALYYNALDGTFRGKGVCERSKIGIAKLVA